MRSLPARRLCTAVLGLGLTAAALAPASPAAATDFEIDDVQIVSRHTAGMWQAQSNGTGDGTQVATYREGGDHDNRLTDRWSLVFTAGWVQFKNAQTGKCAQIMDGAIEYKELHLQPCNSANDLQLFRVSTDPITNGTGGEATLGDITQGRTVLIKPKGNPRLAVALEEQGNRHWTQLQLRTAEPATDRIWMVERYSS
ncbi:RICIN domain-containing protein [Streptomyces cavernicola]|uniref:Ricin B lectin domain-containing protein n=1 Tax=Streptomyces cavernicola TaxID=3043613 RepID=A0ABT6SNB7_9ACTN|nr:hypothetical protein [Streptomyces sp. B-S-A6]MDI3408923.1 hypothetical protein [Streptomyces sp. B-S-A6]